jgi:hypothetical protein
MPLTICGTKALGTGAFLLFVLLRVLRVFVVNAKFKWHELLPRGWAYEKQYLQSAQHTMKHPLQILSFSILCLLLHGCVMSRSSMDRDRTDHLRRNPELVREAVGHVLSVSLTEKENSFTADQFTDREMRKKIESLGRQVTVYYRNTFNPAGADSIVIFKSITPLGTTEVIYDFASVERNFPEKKEKPKEFYFVKVAERTYYVRREVSLM